MEKRINVESNSIKSKEFIICALLLLIIAFSGLYVRTTKLADLSLSIVEPYHIYAAKSILESGKPTLPSGEDYSRSLLFTQTVALSFKFLGINEFAARFPSAIFGTLSIILIFFIGREFFSTGVGLVSAFMVALIPFEVVWSRECRMYTMFQFFFLFGFFAFYKGFENDKTVERKSESVTVRRRSWLNRILCYWNIRLGWLIFSAVLFYVSFTLHPTSASFYASVLLYVFIMFIITLATQGIQIGIRSKYFVSLLLLTIVGVVGWILMGQFIRENYGFSPEWAANRDFLPQFLSFFVSKSLFLVTAFFMLGVIQICTRINKAGFYTLITAVVPLILIVLASVQLPRYILYVFPLIILISSYFICNLFKSESKAAHFHFQENELIKRFSPKIVPIAVGVLFSFCFLSVPVWFILISELSHLPTGPGGEHHANWKEACSYLKRNYKDGDVIIATIPLALLYHCGTVNYSLDDEHIEENKKLGRKESGLLGDIYSDTESITNVEELKKVISHDMRGWLILDVNRFDNPNHVPGEINRFISNNLVHKYTTNDETIFIFNWDKNHSIKD